MAESPLDLDVAGWKQTIRRTLKEMKDDRAPLAAAGMAFYFFLAIFPALIAVVGVLGLVDASQAMLDRINDSIQSTLPGGAGKVLTDAIAEAEKSSERASLIAVLIGLAAAIWSASSGMVGLQSGLNIAYDIRQNRKFVKKRLVALGLVLVTGILGGVPSPLFTFGEAMIFQVIGWVLTTICVIVLFALFYYWGPNRESPQWRWLTPGGIVAAVLWILTSLAFGFYVANFATYSKTYGPMAGVIVLILWLYLSALSIMVGGELNAELERQSNKK